MDQLLNEGEMSLSGRETLAVQGSPCPPLAVGPIRLSHFTMSLGACVTLSCGVVISSALHGQALDAQFGEWAFITYVSTALLIVIAGLMVTMTWVRARQLQGSALNQRLVCLVWAMLAGGFLFLAVDELFSLHEQMDEWIHHFFHLRETPLTDRIDDAIVGCYGLFGLWFLSRYRGELRRLRSVWGTLRMAFLLLFMMVGMDLLTNSWVTGGSIKTASVPVETLATVGSIVEETLKLSSETMFLLAFLSLVSISRAARRSPA